jgi:hypothetical protein
MREAFVLGTNKEGREQVGIMGFNILMGFIFILGIALLIGGLYPGGIAFLALTVILHYIKKAMKKRKR